MIYFSLVFVEAPAPSPVVKQQIVPEGPILPPNSNTQNATTNANAAVQQPSSQVQSDVTFQEVLVENVVGNIARIILRIHLKSTFSKLCWCMEFIFVT